MVLLALPMLLPAAPAGPAALPPTTSSLTQGLGL
jgi:hypothetical protein